MHNKKCKFCQEEEEQIRQKGFREGWRDRDKLDTKDCCGKPPINECACWYLGREETLKEIRKWLSDSCEELVLVIPKNEALKVYRDIFLSDFDKKFLGADK